MTESHQERLQRIKAQFPNAYESWSPEDDGLLSTSFTGGKSVDDLAKVLKRQPSAIRSRLRKLGILKIEETDHTDKTAGLAEFIPVFMKYTLSGEYPADRIARQDRQALYDTVLSQQAINQMTELEFGQVISSLWASQMWGNKGYLVNKLIQENSLPELRLHMKDLLWGSSDLMTRYDDFRKNVKGFGTAMLAEILAFVHPDQCGVWNDRARAALRFLGYERELPFLHKSQLAGQEYQKFNDLLGSLVAELKLQGFSEMDHLGIIYLFYEIWRAGKQETIPVVVESVTPVKTTESCNHDDIAEQIIAIGQALGFQTEKEKLVAKGAKVDVVWQARIANMGVVMYVFEVQSHGSIDSLILNLQRAQVNQSVQRLIVVASAKDIEKIRGEVATLPESFRRAVSYWEAAETMRAAGLVDELFGIINKLELVKSEFGT
jgi:hypothetical protein